MIKPRPAQEHVLYDALYATSKDHILWGAGPGRLIPLVPELTKGRNVFEAGCGDGKNALFLEQHGFTVTGFDSSGIAITGLVNRFQKANWAPKGHYDVVNVLVPIKLHRYDVLISYGLFHCLPKWSRINAHLNLQGNLALGGVVVFACLTNKLPLPQGHGTSGVTLVTLSEVEQLFDGWDIEYCKEGIIEEEHYPTIGQHRHSSIWIIARRVNK